MLNHIDLIIGDRMFELFPRIDHQWMLEIVNVRNISKELRCRISLRNVMQSVEWAYEWVILQVLCCG